MLPGLTNLIHMKRTALSIAIFLVSLYVVITSFSPSRSGNIIEDVLIQTNRFRGSQGLGKLIMNQQLNRIAQKHSIDMANDRVAFGHNGFGERNAAAKKAIHGLSNFAENVAYGPKSGKEVVTMWSTSPGHRKNMLGHYKYIGIGVAKDRDGRNYYTQVFGD